MVSSAGRKCMLKNSNTTIGGEVVDLTVEIGGEVVDLTVDSWVYTWEQPGAA